MELSDMLHPMLELSISIPAIILCFLPMKNHLNGKGKLLLLWGIPTLILWCVGVGWLCWRLRYSTKLCMLLTQALLLLFLLQSSSAISVENRQRISGSLRCIFQHV